MTQYRHMAYVDDPERDQANSLLGAVSGHFAEFFSDPLVFEEDPDPVDPATGEVTGIVRSWGNGGPVLVRPDERRELKNAVRGLNTLAYKEEQAYGQRLVYDSYELFISEAQLRRNGGYVRASGLLKTSGTVEQQLTNDFALIACWDREDLMINCERSGDGNRLNVGFNGTYHQEVRLVWDCPVEFELQGVVNTTATGSSMIVPVGLPQPFKTVATHVFASDDKWGLAVRATGDTGIFRLVQGAWMGVYRVDDDTPEAPPDLLTVADRLVALTI